MESMFSFLDESLVAMDAMLLDSSFFLVCMMSLKPCLMHLFYHFELLDDIFTENQLDRADTKFENHFTWKHFVV